MGARVTRLGVCLLALGAGCGGKPIGAAGADGGAAGRGAAGDVGGTGGGGAGGAKVVGDPGFVGARLLSRREYDNTVRDLLGVEGQARATFPAEWRDGEFENGGAHSVVRGSLFESYFNEAERLSAAAFADPALRARVVVCPQPDSTAGACVRAIVPTLARRAWRRPLTDDEALSLVALADQAVAGGETRDGAIQRALTALLSAAPFVYKLELDPAPASTTPHALTTWELATRLSYTLWATMPDAHLFALAEDGSLARDEVYAAEVDRMLDDARADALIDGFARAWLLGPDGIEAHQVEPTVFPTWNQALAAAMMAEFNLYVREFLRGDRSFATFPAADVNFVNEALARHYDLPTAGLGTELTRVEATTDRRRGFLGLGAFLVATSMGTRTSLTLRGKAVLGDLLCAEIPPPPADIQQFPLPSDPAVMLTPREYFDTLATNPSCGSCHTLFDPYGFALDEMDAIGRFRTTYPDGRPIDAHAVLRDGTSFTGEAELANVIARDPRFVACAGRKALTYALGRPLKGADDRALLALGEAWAREGTTMRALFRRIALSDAFRNRRGEGSP